MTTAFSRLISCTARLGVSEPALRFAARPQQHAPDARATTIKYQLSMMNFTKIPWVGKPQF
jgi:hypothetical protein